MEISLENLYLDLKKTQIWGTELILASSRRSDCGDSTKRSCEQEKNSKGVGVRSESKC